MDDFLAALFLTDPYELGAAVKAGDFGRIDELLDGGGQSFRHCTVGGWNNGVLMLVGRGRAARLRPARQKLRPVCRRAARAHVRATRSKCDVPTD